MSPIIPTGRGNMRNCGHPGGTLIFGNHLNRKQPLMPYVDAAQGDSGFFRAKAKCLGEPTSDNERTYSP